MSLARTVADVLGEHVTLEVESIDRMYLNVYVPILQQEAGVAFFWKHHRGHRFASSALMAPMSESFVSRIEAFAEREHIDLITFAKGQRKDDVAKDYLSRFSAKQGVLFIAKAQEKATVVRTQKRRSARTGAAYAWLAKTTAIVNQYYFYCVDEDFGPFFLKFCSYFPYNGKLCINGHEYLKRQLQKRGIAFEALDNGILSCEHPDRLQRIADELSPEKIDALARKWFRLLPHPFTADDRRARFLYQISILQAEFSLTQVLDRPLTGRVFFEQVIRDNLDLGRPDQVQLIFGQRVTRRTPGRFRTRVITEGVIPSLHIDFKHCKIKQYHKEARALRTETTINDTYDFAVGRKLTNLPALRKIGFAANRRLLGVQRISYDCSVGEDVFAQIQRPVEHQGQRAAGLRFGDPRVLALLSALVVFRLLPHGFSNQDLRELLAPLLGLSTAQFTQGRMTYDLRRLRLHGLVQRIPKSNRYQVTQLGCRTALFYHRLYARMLRPGLAMLGPPDPPAPTALRNALTRLESTLDDWIRAA